MRAKVRLVSSVATAPAASYRPRGSQQLAASSRHSHPRSAARPGLWLGHLRCRKNSLALPPMRATPDRGVDSHAHRWWSSTGHRCARRRGAAGPARPPARRWCWTTAPPRSPGRAVLRAFGRCCPPACRARPARPQGFPSGSPIRPPGCARRCPAEGRERRHSAKARAQLLASGATVARSDSIASASVRRLGPVLRAASPASSRCRTARRAGRTGSSGCQQAGLKGGLAPGAELVLHVLASLRSGSAARSSRLAWSTLGTYCAHVVRADCFIAPGTPPGRRRRHR